MTKKMLKEAQDQALQALGMIESERADAIIGEQTEELKKLIHGMKGVYMMLWIMALNNGMRKTKATMDMGSQALIIMTTMIHHAYALGIKKGRESE